MYRKKPTRNVDRRKLLNGGWAERPNEEPIASFEIASILVQVRPERLEAAIRDIETLPETQIFSRDPKGKLVVVVETVDVGRIGETLNVISLMPDVLTAALVFQGTDA